MITMIQRPTYLDQLIRLKDKQLIKVVTGLRRCGKTTLFEMYCDYLKHVGVEDQQIIKINLEDPDYHYLDHYMSLYQYIKERLCKEKMNYIFIDEVQMVPDFQKTVDGLFIQENCDVYITGSNAFLRSGELATLLSGRYIELQMLPLSFKEFASCFGESVDPMRLYQRYIQNGAFPYVLQLEKKKDINAYLEGIYTSIIMKDVVTRHRIGDVAALDRIVRFMFDNIGNLCSTSKIVNTMVSSGRKISLPTVETYLDALVKSYILYKVDRYDVKGRNYLSYGSKYYVSDIGLRFYLLGTKHVDMGHILENVIYLELIRRGYEVHVGKVGTTEIDFIAISDQGEEYYQVAYTVMDGETLKRELTPLEAVKDHNPKYLLTMDVTPMISHNGIKQLNALDWLLQE